ncbi:hypothetical protein DDONNNOJ_00056 [Citrobacter phage BSwS KMM3]|nr:hypothetical protein DDONNNOJ_00056 [Citrobacter phage BSwS KMM3]
MGVYDDVNKSFVPLGIAQGGTGAENVTQAKINLQVDRIIQDSVFTSMLSPDGLKEISVRNDGTWGMFNRDLKGWSALGIAQGGTGATTVAKARENLLVDQVDRSGEQTILWAPDKDTYLFVYNHGDWGVYDRSAGTRKPLPIESGGTGGYNQYTARKALGIATDDVVWFKGLVAFDITGVGGAWTAVVRKLQDQAASDGANLLSYVENKWFGVQNYVAGALGNSINMFGLLTHLAEMSYGIQCETIMDSIHRKVAALFKDLMFALRIDLNLLSLAHGIALNRLVLWSFIIRETMFCSVDTLRNKWLK